VTGTPLDQRVRDELCDLLLALGPDAPTLCEGWTTLDLAAHLVLREREPWSAAGVLIERFADRTHARQQALADTGIQALVAKLRTPPLVPWGLPGLRTLVNLNEFAIHHEDVRRANGRDRRTDRPDLDDAMWKILGGAGKLATRQLGPVGLELVRPGGERRTIRKGSPVATLTGHPVELALYLNGRKAHAEVALGGDPAAAATVEATAFGL
jgi:uncharacterized protein (TIGR03085 family)